MMGCSSRSVTIRPPRVLPELPGAQNADGQIVDMEGEEAETAAPAISRLVRIVLRLIGGGTTRFVAIDPRNPKRAPHQDRRCAKLLRFANASTTDLAKGFILDEPERAHGGGPAKAPIASPVDARARRVGDAAALRQRAATHGRSVSPCCSPNCGGRLEDSDQFIAIFSAIVRLRLVIAAYNTYIQSATAFPSGEVPTVVLPIRLVRVWSKQKNFQTDCFVSAAPATAWAQPDALGKIMTIGTVKFFNTVKGFGFISPEGGGKDVFVHSSAVETAGMRVLAEGQRVSFEIQTDLKGPKAVNLQTA